MSSFLRNIRRKIYSTVHNYIDPFVFIHINKTGGSSVERALKLPFEHKTAMEKIAEMGLARWNKKVTFAVVRNPWDKVVFHYHYRVMTNKTGLESKSVDFKKWVKLTYGEQNPLYFDIPKMFMPQIDWIADEQGNILVDYIVHFENLNVEFSKVCQKFGKDVILPHVKASKRGKYSDYYDDETIKVIQDWFSRDIEMFGYKF